MIKTALFRINHLFILFLVLIILCIPVFSNQAQVSIFNAGINLGLAKARVQLWGQDAFENAILRDLGLAKETIMGAEILLAQFTTICENRTDLINRIISKIDNYQRQTRNMRVNARMSYINDIFEMYRSALKITLQTSRLDSCRSQPNCDGHLVRAGYKFGQAWVSTESRNNRARSFQIGRIGEMKDSIRKGIWMSMDRANLDEIMTGINKLCCGFGDHEEWRRFMNSFGRNTPRETFRNLLPGIQGTIRRAVVTAADCRAGADRREENRREENLVRGNIRTNVSYVFWDGNERNNAKFFRDGRFVFTGRPGGRGRWSLNPDTNILTMSGLNRGSFSGPVYRYRNGFKVIGQWSDGTRVTIAFTPDSQ